MELRNFTFIHLCLLIFYNLAINLGIMAFSLGFLLQSEDDFFEDAPKKPHLANIISFSINFLGIYFIVIIILSFFFTKDGQVVFDGFKRPIKYNRNLETIIFGTIFNGLYFLFIFIFYWPLYAIIKCFGKFNSRYVSLILIICVDIIVFFFSLVSDNKDVGFIKTIMAFSIMQIAMNLLSMIIPNTCWKCESNEKDPKIKPKKEEEENSSTRIDTPPKTTNSSYPIYTPPSVNPQPPSLNVNVSISIPNPVVNVQLPHPVIVGPYPPHGIHGPPHHYI